MPRELNVIIERDHGGCYVGSVPGLKGCHTQARSLAVLLERMREVIELYLEVEAEEPEPLETIPETTLEDLVGCTGYHGPRKSLAEMEAAIARGARQRA